MEPIIGITRVTMSLLITTNSNAGRATASTALDAMERIGSG